MLRYQRRPRDLLTFAGPIAILANHVSLLHLTAFWEYVRFAGWRHGELSSAAQRRNGPGNAHERNYGNGWPRARKPPCPSPSALVMASSRLRRGHDGPDSYWIDPLALEWLA